MMEDGKTYQGKVIEAGYAEAATGTESLQVGADIGEAEPVYYDLWLTENNKERVEKTLKEFGISVKDAEFWADPLAKLKDQPCSVVAGYDEKYKVVKVKWFNGPHRVSGTKRSDAAKGARAAARMFGFTAAVDDDGTPTF